MATHSTLISFCRREGRYALQKSTQSMPYTQSHDGTVHLTYTAPLLPIQLEPRGTAAFKGTVCVDTDVRTATVTSTFINI